MLSPIWTFTRPLPKLHQIEWLHIWVILFIQFFCILYVRKWFSVDIICPFSVSLSQKIRQKKYFLQKLPRLKVICLSTFSAESVLCLRKWFVVDFVCPLSASLSPKIRQRKCFLQKLSKFISGEWEIKMNF